MIYEKRPDTVEAVQYMVENESPHFSVKPEWLKRLLNPSFNQNPVSNITVEPEQLVLFDWTGNVAGYDVEFILPTDWIVKDENGKIAIYDDETFIRKFKKVA